MSETPDLAPPLTDAQEVEASKQQPQAQPKYASQVDEHPSWPEIDYAQLQARGFWVAIDTPDAQERRSAIKELKSQVVQPLTWAAENFRSRTDMEMLHLEGEIQMLETQARREQEDLALCAVNALPVLIQELEEHQQALVVVKEELQNVMADFSAAKRQAVDVQIHQTHEQLKTLTESYLQVEEGRRAIADRSMELYRNVLGSRVALLQDFAKKYKDRMQKVYEILLHNPSINDRSRKLLNTLGIAVVGVAGWLFALFTIQKGADAGGYADFLNEGFFGVAAQGHMKGWSAIGRILWMELWVVILLSVIGGLAWASDKLLTLLKSKKKKEDVGERDEFIQELNIEMREEEESKFRLRLSTKSFLRLWLRVAPLILVASVVINLLTSTGSNDFSKLHLSMLGQAVGSALTLLLSIVFKLHFEHSEGQPSPPAGKGRLKNMRRDHGWLLGLFVGACLFMALLPDNGSPALNVTATFKENLMSWLNAHSWSGTVPMLAYVPTAIFAAYVMGRAEWYKSLISTYGMLNEKINRLHTLAEYASAPFPTFLTKERTWRFKLEYRTLEKRLFALMRRRIEAVELMAFSHTMAPDEKQFQGKKNRKREWWTELTGRNKPSATLFKPEIWMNTIEAEEFPEWRNKITSLSQEKVQLESELTTLKSKLADARNGDTACRQVLEERISALRDQEMGLRRRAKEAAIRAASQQARLMHLRITAENAIDDGANLGITWLANSGSPSLITSQSAKQS